MRLAATIREPLAFLPTVADPLQQRLVSRRQEARSLVRVGEEARSELPIEAMWGQIVKLYQTGLHPSIALCMRHRGDVVMDRTIGHLENHPHDNDVGEVVTPDSLFSLFSASKIVTAMVLHSLMEDGLLHLNDRAVDYVPEFGKYGKEAIRIRHLMNHTAGIPDMPADIDVDAAVAAGKLDMEHLGELRLKTRPGADVAYHPMTSWLLLGEIVERATGRNLREHLVERFLDPLGFKHLNYGVSEGNLDKVAMHALTGPKVPGFMQKIFERTVGADIDYAMEMTNRPEFLTALLPSANIIGSPRETSRFMQMLLNGGVLDGVRVLDERTVRRAVSQVTPTQMDSTFGFPMRYGLGVMMGGNRFSLFGLGTGDAYGHLGMSNVIVYADPARDLTVSFLNTGKPFLAPGTLRWLWVLQHIVLNVPKR